MIECDQCGRKAPKPGNHVRWYLLSKDSRIPFLLCWECRDKTLKEHPETVDIVEVRGRYSPDQDRALQAKCEPSEGML